MSRIDVLRVTLVGTVLVVLGCDDGEDPFADMRDPCVEKINGYRATLDLPPLERWAESESCADNQARKDAKSGNYHGSFSECGEVAQNECMGDGTADEVIDRCLEEMWAEGPGEDFDEHGHYITMSSTAYTKAACGFFKTSSGRIWSVQNFK